MAGRFNAGLVDGLYHLEDLILLERVSKRTRHERDQAQRRSSGLVSESSAMRCSICFAMRLSRR